MTLPQFIETCGYWAVLPFTIGMSGISVLRFEALNLIGALIWAASGTALGYLLGDAAEAILGNIKDYEGEVLIAIALGGLAYWMYTRRQVRAVSTNR